MCVVRASVTVCTIVHTHRCEDGKVMVAKNSAIHTHTHNVFTY